MIVSWLQTMLDEILIVATALMLLGLHWALAGSLYSFFVPRLPELTRADIADSLHTHRIIHCHLKGCPEKGLDDSFAHSL